MTATTRKCSLLALLAATLIRFAHNNELTVSQRDKEQGHAVSSVFG